MNLRETVLVPAWSLTWPRAEGLIWSTSRQTFITFPVSEGAPRRLWSDCKHWPLPQATSALNASLPIRSCSRQSPTNLSWCHGQPGHKRRDSSQSKWIRVSELELTMTPAGTNMTPAGTNHDPSYIWSTPSAWLPEWGSACSPRVVVHRGWEQFKQATTNHLPVRLYAGDWRN